MSHIFANTLNTRPIFENSLKFIRSDVPTEITEGEIQWLLTNNIVTVVDLRTAEERAKKECPLIKDDRFSYHCFTLAGGDKIPPTVDDVSESYIGMVDSQFDNLIEFLSTIESNVLYFCNAGKDRTGVLSAVLLYKSGAELEYIIEDYMKTKDNLEKALNDFAKSEPNIDINVITPCRRYIEEFLDRYINRNK
ncbi:MAG: tyrosine-protein phosphatase [Clostridia bacterium]|nr:tyrosine-protein phosphatase [Clostridia bacterium]